MVTVLIKLDNNNCLFQVWKTANNSNKKKINIEAKCIQTTQ